MWPRPWSGDARLWSGDALWSGGLGCACRGSRASAVLVANAGVGEQQRTRGDDGEQDQAEAVAGEDLLVGRAHDQRREVPTETTGGTDKTGHRADPLGRRALRDPGEHATGAEAEE